MSSWITAKLKDVAKIVTGKTPKTSNPNYYGNDIPFVTPADLNEGIFEDAKIYLTHLGADQVYKVPKNTVLVSCIGNLGKLTIVDREVCFNQQINGLIFDEQKIFPKYGFYYAQTLKPQLEKASSSTTLPIVNKSRFSELEIQYPPLEEQCRIAGILDKADSLIQKRKAAIAKLDELLQATFIDMFGDPVTNPKGWGIGTLDDLGNIDRGVSKHRPRGAPELLGGNHPLIQTSDVSRSDGYIRSYTSTYSDIGLAQSKKWNKGTLCITIAANIANTGILMFDACFPDSIVGFISNEKSNVEFVQGLFSFFQQILEEKAPQSAQKNINLAILRSLEIPIPPKELQNQWAEFAKAVEGQKQRLEGQLETQETLFKALQQQAFSGQL